MGWVQPRAGGLWLDLHHLLAPACSLAVLPAGGQLYQAGELQTASVLLLSTPTYPLHLSATLRAQLEAAGPNSFWGPALQPREGGVGRSSSGAVVAACSFLKVAKHCLRALAQTTLKPV